MQITCAIPGCAKPHRAKGCCSTHYNQTRQPHRHRKLIVLCTRCARPCIKDATRDRRYAALFCSLECRDDQRQMHKLPALFMGDVTRPRRPSPEPGKPRLWTAGQCLRCKAHFIDRQPTARFCSHQCGRVYWRKRLKKISGIARPVRLYVLRRDKWRCQICMRPIMRRAVMPHPLSPTIDHVIPQSQGGTHDPSNLRAAHFLCNATRGGRGGHEQLALLG